LEAIATQRGEKSKSKKSQMEYPSVTDVFETRKVLSNRITNFCRSKAIPRFRHVATGRLHFIYQCVGDKCGGCIEGKQQIRVVDGKKTTKGSLVTVTKSVNCNCGSIPFQSLALGKIYENWDKAMSAIACYCSKELQLTESFELAHNNASYRNYKCRSRHCANYPNCAGKVVVKSCIAGKEITGIVPCSAYESDTENEITGTCFICQSPDIKSYLVCGQCRDGASCICQDDFEQWHKSRPPILRGKGEVARWADEFKMCPCCRFAPILQFQPEDANAKPVDIPYPFGFKNYNTPVMTQDEFEEARYEQLHGGHVSQSASQSVSSNSEEEVEQVWYGQEELQAISRMEELEETLSSAEFKSGFQAIMSEFGMYAVTLHLRLCYYRALLREEFERERDWATKLKRLYKIARLARRDIFICKMEAKDDESIREFCTQCVQALRRRRTTREIVHQRFFWNNYASHFHINLTVRRFVDLVED
jgi:hypothetical protein